MYTWPMLIPLVTGPVRVEVTIPPNTAQYCLVSAVQGETRTPVFYIRGQNTKPWRQTYMIPTGLKGSKLEVRCDR